jgi:hypothetical protein
MFVHLIEYRIVPGHEAEVTGFLRHEALGGPPPEGMVARYAGRRLSGEGRRHLVATAWRDAAALAAGTDPRGVPGYLAGKAELLADPQTSLYRAVAATGLGRDGARVLRVYRTSIAADAIGEWESRAQETLDGLVGRPGMWAAVAGVWAGGREVTLTPGEAGIVVLTAWTEWDGLLAATGGRLERTLIDTEMSDLERAARADHFELLSTDPGPH